jgi:hypothetical protein
MAAITVEFPAHIAFADLDPALRELADKFGCEISYAPNATYKVVPRERGNVRRLPARPRQINQPGPGAA